MAGRIPLTVQVVDALSGAMETARREHASDLLMSQLAEAQRLAQLADLGRKWTANERDYAEVTPQTVREMASFGRRWDMPLDAVAAAVAADSNGG